MWGLLTGCKLLEEGIRSEEALTEKGCASLDMVSRTSQAHFM